MDKKEERLIEAADQLMEIVEGTRLKRWSVGGIRLVDTKEWCEFYNSWAALRSVGGGTPECGE